MNSIKAALVSVLIIGLAELFSCKVEDSSPAQPQIDAKAADVVRKMADYYRDLKSFEGAVKIELANSSGSVPAAGAQFMAQRPNLLSIVPKSTNESVLISDGTNVFEYHPEYYKIYYVSRAPPELEGITNGKPGIVLHTMCMLDRYGYVTSGFDNKGLSEYELSALRYLGTDTVEGVTCDHLQMLQRPKNNTPVDGPVATTNDLWIASGSAPFAVRFQFRSIGPGFNLKTGAEITNDVMVMTETVSHWRADAAMPPGQFKFVPPPDSVRVSPQDKKKWSPTRTVTGSRSIEIRVRLKPRSACRIRRKKTALHPTKGKINKSARMRILAI